MTPEHNMQTPTQQQKGVAILKWLGYRIWQTKKDGRFHLFLPNESVAHKMSTFSAYNESYTAEKMLDRFNPYIHYPICFEEIKPKMEAEGFHLMVMPYRGQEIIFRQMGTNGQAFYGNNKDIRIAICDACYSYIQTLKKV